MRACVQTLLQPLLRASEPTTELGVAPLVGVPAFDPAAADPLHAVLGAVLAYHGRALEAPLVAAATGAAGQVAWRGDYQCCPGAVCAAADDLLGRLGRVAGVVWRQRSGLSFAQSLALLRRQLALGRPVLTCGLTGDAAWSVILGVSPLTWRRGRRPDEPPVPWLTVTARVAGEPAGGLVREVTAWSGYVPGRATRIWDRLPLAWIETVGERPDEATQRRLAVESLVAEPAVGGPYRRGAAAYEAWVAGLREQPEIEVAPDEELDRQAAGHAHLAARFAALRRAALAFGDHAALTTPNRAAARLLALAAREYAGCAHHLQAVADAFPAAEAVRREAYRAAPWREGLARSLTEAQRHDALAAGFLRRALGHL